MQRLTVERVMPALEAFSNREDTGGNVILYGDWGGGYRDENEELRINCGCPATIVAYMESGVITDDYEGTLARALDVPYGYLECFTDWFDRAMEGHPNAVTTPAEKLNDADYGDIDGTAVADAVRARAGEFDVRKATEFLNK